MSNSYVDSFGLTQYLGVGAGRDELCDASAKPSTGSLKFIEVIVNENGPLPNVGTSYGRGAACIPAGSLIGRSALFVDEKGSAASVVLSLVKKDGSDAQAMMAATTPDADGVVINANLLNGQSFGEDRYVKAASGTFTGLKGRLYIEFV